MYLKDANGAQNARDLPSMQVLPKLLLMNLNLNFTKLKSDFMEPLDMVKKLIKDSQDEGVSFPVLDAISIPILYKHMSISNNLDQKILAFRTIARLTCKLTEANSQFLLQELKLEELAAQDKLIRKESHESQLNTLVRLSLSLILLNHFAEFMDPEGRAAMRERLYSALQEETAKNVDAVKQSMTPNVKQKCRLLITCVNLIAKFRSTDNQ